MFHTFLVSSREYNINCTKLLIKGRRGHPLKSFNECSQRAKCYKIQNMHDAESQEQIAPVVILKAIGIMCFLFKKYIILFT